jgi:hypothetical protein
MLTPLSILESLQPLSTVEGYSAAKTFLLTPGTRLHQSGSDGRVTAKETHDIWRFRFERAQNGIIRPIPGLEYLVGALGSLPGETILKGIIFENDGAISAFWFDDQIGSPVGFVVCERTAARDPMQF